jgi:hypothetical protein
MKAKTKGTPKPKAVQIPRNPLIEPTDLLQDNLSRAHAYAVFLQSASEQMFQNPLNGELYGRSLAHEVLADALAWLKEKEAA